MKKAGAAAIAAMTIMGTAGAEPGMWMPDQTVTLAPALKRAGLKMSPEALGDLSAAPLNAIVSLGGCSAAFMSPEGLIATNHRCVYGSIQYNATPEKNLLRDGFLAKSLGEELPAAPGTRAFVIEDLSEVTPAMLSGVTDAMSGFDRETRLEANRKRLIAECEKAPNRRCDVRAYYGGAKYYLQKQLEIKDVRLVYAPAGGVGDFGGEVDNWQWPRHTGDFAFYRAYVAPDGASASFDKANVPYRPNAHLKIARQGLKPGDFVMLAGFPGTTDRLRTADEADFYYREFYPRQQRLLSEYSDAITTATSADPASAIKYANAVRGADNYKKKLLGQMAGADAVKLGEKKRGEEEAFRAWAVADEARRARLQPVIADLDAIVREANEALSVNQISGLLNRAQLLSAARTALRWSQEREKPDAEREAGYQDRDRQLTVERLTQIERRFDPAVDRVVFEQALAEYRKLPADKRDMAFERALADIGMARLYADTKLADTPTRLGWLDRPVKDFLGSKDPFIRLAVALSPGDLAAEKQSKDLAGRMQKARSAYMSAMLDWAASEGRAIAPDANGSLRFTYGEVTGKTRDGMSWSPFTTIEGVIEKDTGKDPFDSPKALLEKARARDFGRYASPALKTLPVNYLTTLDITNGNSGSATLNARGEFVGLAFDGTLDGVIADWWYEPAINRTIHVDSRYMLWVMEKVDGASRLIDEMDAR
jgi:hypothetical protein